MARILISLVLAASLLPGTVAADERPAKGKLLVATEVIHGDLFTRTVVLLLHYDASGAVGLVINRPTGVHPQELLADDEEIAAYDGTLYWGGPVDMNSVRAVLRSATPPPNAEPVVGTVYLLPYADALAEVSVGTSQLRFFIGMASWAPGQLNHELVRGSWVVVPATDERIFAQDPRLLWQRLAPHEVFRAASGGAGGDLSPIAGSSDR
ncbi:MAG: YqgE/AlgH family protein [Gammaproteobacteria bacterium]|nr:YqgE/AlgH family protein [Gammaproteobacteria bacterium]